MTWKIFQKKRAVQTKKIENPVPRRVKIAIVAFEDNCMENTGRVLAEALSRNALYQVTFYNETLDKKFLNLQSQDFFDFIDAGNYVLKATKGDVLIWGWRENNNIRLNFQTKGQYELLTPLFFSLLNSLYVPLSYFQQKQFPLSMLTLIEGAILAVLPSSFGFDKNFLLEKLVNKISISATPEGLSYEFRPYVLNMLALVYLHSIGDNIKVEEVKRVAYFLDIASKSLRNAKHVPSNVNLLMGNIFTNFGQLFHIASETITAKKFLFSRKAIQSFHIAQKHINRYAFPYDFGLISIRLSKLYFLFWKQTTDVQALRDAVYYLRDAEKIFSNILFPHLWAQIQGDLGFYLSLLGMFSHNDEIAMLAVENYQNRQRIFTKELKPYDWAKTEENIGHIFYHAGKNHQHEEYLQEAIKYYQSSAEVYENYNYVMEQKQIQNCLMKVDNFILHLRRQKTGS